MIALIFLITYVALFRFEYYYTRPTLIALFDYSCFSADYLGLRLLLVLHWLPVLYLILMNGIDRSNYLYLFL